jgi:hypothetical protein
MNSRVDPMSAAGARSSPGRYEDVAASLATALAGGLRRAARAFAAARERAGVAVLAWRERPGDWQTAARLRYLGRAVDLPDLERRQRAWDRDESNSYSMSCWS